MIGLYDGRGVLGVCGHDVRFCDCGVRDTVKAISNTQQREAALKAWVNEMPANLLRAYVTEALDQQDPATIDKWVVALRAQDKVPAKETK